MNAALAPEKPGMAKSSIVLVDFAGFENSRGVFQMGGRLLCDH
jgi:hypothetical protein